MHVTCTQAFPARVRYASSALGYDVGAVIGGGLTPYLAALCTRSTGVPQAAALPGANLMVTPSFVRAAVEQADLDALRIALHHATGDESLAATSLRHTGAAHGGGMTMVVVDPRHRRSPHYRGT